MVSFFKKIKVENEEKPSQKKIKAETKIENEELPEAEGQLAIDVYQTEKELVVQSTIAGVKPENLDISIERDMVAIKGQRERPEKNNKNYFYQECYWGPFSRQIILPEEVDGSKAKATMIEGILTITIPKIDRLKKRKIIVKN